MFICSFSSFFAARSRPQCFEFFFLWKKMKEKYCSLLKFACGEDNGIETVIMTGFLCPALGFWVVDFCRVFKCFNFDLLLLRVDFWFAQKNVRCFQNIVVRILDGNYIVDLVRIGPLIFIFYFFLKLIKQFKESDRNLKKKSKSNRFLIQFKSNKKNLCFNFCLLILTNIFLRNRIK